MDTSLAGSNCNLIATGLRLFQYFLPGSYLTPHNRPPPPAETATSATTPAFKRCFGVAGGFSLPATGSGS